MASEPRTEAGKAHRDWLLGEGWSAAKLRHPVPDSVALVGGPMDGWVVTPAAPSLLPDWWKSWPASVAARFAPGRYGPPVVDDAGVRRSTWDRLPIT